MVVRDDLRRSRPTVAFRWLLALPHFLWLGLWGTAILILLPVMWVITLVKGEPNRGLHEMYAMYLRYTLHVYAYASLAAEPFPGFLGQRAYPVDLVVPPPGRQSRWSVAFRAILVLPPLMFAGALGSGVVSSVGTAVAFGIGLANIALVLAWFACLARGRMPEGLRDALVWTIAYAIQVAAYLFCMTGAYPDSDPRAVPLTPRPDHPVTMRNDDEPRRHRLLVGLRFALLMPHVVWATLWSVVVLAAGLVAWLAALVLGRVPAPLHRFLAAYVRYTTHLSAFAYLAGGPFPGFAGKGGAYPLDLDIAAPQPQSRASIGFRWLLAFPALLLAGGMGTVLATGAVGAWFFALARGRVPDGLHRALAYAVRYSGQASAYALLLCEDYPHSGPSEERILPYDPLLAPERPRFA